MLRRAAAILGLVAIAVCRPATAQTGSGAGPMDPQLAVPAHLKDLDSTWRRVQIRLAPAKTGPSALNLATGALSGDDQPKAYYTQGRTAEWAGRTWIVACRPASSPVNLAALKSMDRPDQVMDALLPAAKPDTPLELALIPLDGAASIESVQPFDLQQATTDRAAFSSPTMTLAAVLFPIFSQAREKARETSSVSNLKQMAIATLMYSQDWDEVLPPMKDAATARKALMPYCKNEAIFIDPRTNEPYHVNVAASRKKEASIDSPSEFVLFYEATPARDGKRAVAFADGHVKRILDPEWEMLRRKSGMP